MIANLYLLNESFCYQKDDPIENVSSKIQELNSQILKIKKDIHDNGIDQDLFLKNPNIFEVKIFDEYTIFDVLYSGADIFNDHDVKKALSKIIEKCKDCNLLSDEIVEKIKNNNEEKLDGIILLQSLDIPEVNCNCTISTIEDWFLFHRSYLAHFPKSTNSFFEEIQQYFFNIVFHPNIRRTLDTLEGGLKNFSRQIIHYLTQLNDRFQSITRGKPLNLALKEFEHLCDVVCSLEGDIYKRERLRFPFTQNGISRDILCEPHLKLDRSDDAGDACHRYSNRIYFCQGVPDFHNGKILVGHIGQHL